VKLGRRFGEGFPVGKESRNSAGSGMDCRVAALLAVTVAWGGNGGMVRVFGWNLFKATLGLSWRGGLPTRPSTLNLAGGVTERCVDG
jgi:hypothetical protein